MYIYIIIYIYIHEQAICHSYLDLPYRVSPISSEHCLPMTALQHGLEEVLRRDSTVHSYMSVFALTCFQYWSMENVHTIQYLPWVQINQYGNSLWVDWWIDWWIFNVYYSIYPSIYPSNIQSLGNILYLCQVTSSPNISNFFHRKGPFWSSATSTWPCWPWS